MHRRNRRALRMRTLMLAAACAWAVPANAAPVAWDALGAGNPLLPGYFADPSIVHDGGHWYIFATADPWGGDHVALWQSENGRDWRYSRPAWPTKAAATSPTSGDAMVWAPSVVKARGRWWMYVSVGSEIWVGSAPSPAGPWADANNGRPLIPGNFRPGFHMIDAEAFVDDDGQAWLAWGSGLNWVNGHCFVAKLARDMVHLDGAVRDVTPAHYFEAPFLFKARGHYHLTYSAGNTTRDTYQVRDAIGPGPQGPFTESANSPILQTQPGDQIISPGHHALFRSGGQAFVLYHRQALPWTPGRAETLRQIAVDAVDAGADGLLRVHGRAGPGGDHAGVAVPGWAATRTRGLMWHALGQGDDAAHSPDKAADDNYATLWRPAGDGQLTADLGRVRRLGASLLRPEYPDRPYRFALSASRDGQHWRMIAPAAAREGSPIVVPHAIAARYLRLEVAAGAMGLWEWTILPPGRGANGGAAPAGVVRP